MIRLAILLASTSSVSGQPVRTHDAPPLGVPQIDLSETDVRLRRLFIRGLTRAELDDHTEAVDLLTQALQLAPEHPAIAAALAASYQALDNTSTALYYAQVATAGDPGNAFYQIQLARLYRASSDVHNAIAAYRAALALTPRDEEALTELAQMLAASRDYRGAIDGYERLLAIQGETLDVRQQVLNLYTMLDDSAGVRQTLEALLHLEPSSVEFRRRLSQVYVQQGKPDKATALFEDLLAADSSNTQAYQALVDLRRTLGTVGTDDAAPLADAHPEPALSLQTEPISDEPAPDQSLLADAQAAGVPGPATARSNKERAVTEAEGLARMLEANPRDLHLWARVAQAYRRVGDVENAYRVLEDALLLFPGQPLLLGTSALTLLDMNRLDESAALLDEALSFLAEDDVADIELRSLLLAGQAMVYERYGDTQKSDSLYDAALDLQPRNGLALASYAASLAGRGSHMQRALSLAQESISLTPQDPASLHALGYVYLKQGDLQQARTWLERAIEAGSVNARTFQYLGDVHERLGDMAGAKYFWQEALYLDPNVRAVIQKLD